MTEPVAVADDALSRQLRGFGPAGIGAVLGIFAVNLIAAPLGAVLVLFWARRSHTPWPALGFRRPRSWGLTIVSGIVLGVAFKLLMKAVVMPWLGAPPVNPVYHYLTGNPAALPGAVFMMIVVAGFGEETLYRGFLFERLGRMLGPGRRAKVLIVVFSALLFASLHLFDQGLPGAEQAIITGLTFGTLFMVTGQLWLPMCVHAAFDLTSVAMIYWDVEAAVAHSVFH